VAVKAIPDIAAAAILKPLTVMVTPLLQPARPLAIALALPRPGTLLLNSDPKRTVQLSTDRLRRTFSLTGAEANRTNIGT
jgi:hypothetical protein